MKTMKKLVAALLVLTMVLALTGTAMAACSFKPGTYVKFTKNGYAYSEPKASKKVSGPEVIVSKGSIAKVIAKKGSYVFLQLTPGYYNSALGNTYEVSSGLYAWGYWFKTSVLGDTAKTDIIVRFSNGGVGKSKPADGPYVDDSAANACKKHIKADAKVWMHKTYSLSNNYGKALRKGDKVTYRHLLGIDTRGVVFYGIKYSGKCLWVSSLYTHPVK